MSASASSASPSGISTGASGCLRSTPANRLIVPAIFGSRSSSASSVFASPGLPWLKNAAFAADVSATPSPRSHPSTDSADSGWKRTRSDRDRIVGSSSDGLSVTRMNSVRSGGSSSSFSIVLPRSSLIAWHSSSRKNRYGSRDGYRYASRNELCSSRTCFSVSFAVLGRMPTKSELLPDSSALQCAHSPHASSPSASPLSPPPARFFSHTSALTNTCAASALPSPPGPVSSTVEGSDPRAVSRVRKLCAISFP